MAKVFDCTDECTARVSKRCDESEFADDRTMNENITITPVALMGESTYTLPFDYHQCKDFWLQRRNALLQEVEAIERALNIQPRTAQCRRKYKQEQ